MTLYRLITVATWTDVCTVFNYIDTDCGIRSHLGHGCISSVFVLYSVCRCLLSGSSPVAWTATKYVSTGFRNLELTGLGPSWPVSTTERSGEIRHMGPVGIAGIAHMNGALCTIHVLVILSSPFKSTLTITLCMLLFHLVTCHITIP